MWYSTLCINAFPESLLIPECLRVLAARICKYCHRMTHLSSGTFVAGAKQIEGIGERPSG
jgi:hypothetical protein